MDAGSTPKGMLIYSGRTVLRWGNFRNSFGYFFASPYLALSMTVLPFFFHGHDFSYIVSHLLRVTIRSFLFRFSLRSLGLLLREPGDSRGFFFFFSFERTVVENSADLKIITKLERSSRSRDRLSSTNLHDSKRPINFRSKKFTR